MNQWLSLINVRRQLLKERSFPPFSRPIIALSADVQKDIVNLCQVAGMDDYLSKPYKESEFIKTLQRWLQP